MLFVLSDGQPLPSIDRVVNRILNGDLVIFNKASLYNANSSTYDGRHSKIPIVCIDTYAIIRMAKLN